MFTPYNGRLVNAKNRIFVVFSHNNLCGRKPYGSRDDKNGDSTVFLDLENGSNVG